MSIPLCENLKNPSVSYSRNNREITDDISRFTFSISCNAHCPICLVFLYKYKALMTRITFTFVFNFLMFNVITKCFNLTVPDSKVHVDNMGPTWVLSAPDGPQCWPNEPCYQGSSFNKNLVKMLEKWDHAFWDSPLNIISNQHDARPW